MFVKSLELNNFRNYNDLSIELSENTNIFYGDNAQGKTNILEAIYLASTTKSHKGSKDREIIWKSIASLHKSVAIGDSFARSDCRKEKEAYCLW